MTAPRRRTLLLVGVGVLILAAAAVVVLALAQGDDDGYSDETRAAFLEACTGDGGDDVATVCECLYDGIRDELPYDRFVEVDEQLRAERGDEADAVVETLPDDVDRIRATCVEEVGPVAPTTTATTA